MKKISALGVFIWTLASLFFLYEFFSRTFIGTIADAIMAQLDLSALQLSIIGAAYYLIYASMQVPVGIVIDRWGVRKPLFLAVLVCVLGLFLFSFADSFITLILARFLMGFGSAFAFVSLLVLALNWFPKHNFGFFSGATQVLGAIGPILSGAPLVAMLVATNNDWREVLYYVVGFGIALAIFILVFIRDRPKTMHKFKVYQQQKKTTLGNLKTMVTNRRVLWIAAYAFCIYAAISVLGAIWGTYYLQTHGIHRNTAASITSMIWLGLATGSPLLGYFSDAIKQRRLPLIGCAIFAFCVILAIIFYPGNNPYVFTVLYFCFGLSGAGQTLSFASLSDHVDIRQLATALGFNNTAVMLGGAIIPVIIGGIVEYSAHGTSPYTSSDFTDGFLIIPVLYLAATLIAWFKIPDRTGRSPFKERVQP